MINYPIKKSPINYNDTWLRIYSNGLQISMYSTCNILFIQHSFVKSHKVHNSFFAITRYGFNVWAQRL